MSTQGTITRKPNGRWYVATHYKDAAGRRRQKSHGGFRTKAEARQRLNAVLADMATGRYVSPSKDTFGQFLSNRWLPAVKASLRPSTYDSYARNIRVHVLPRLGSLRLQELSTVHLQTLYSELLESGRATGEGGLSPRTVRYIHRTLKKALSDAVAWGLISVNPAATVVPPKVEAPERATWTPAELNTFLRYVEGDSLEPAWHLLATTGMRRGEVLGLRWSDVDLVRRTITISRAAVVVSHKVVDSQPKTRRSRRTLPIDARTEELLRRHRTRQLEERLMSGVPASEDDLLFTWPDGRPIHPTWLSKKFRRLSVEAGLPDIRLHDLRHTFATTALASGVQPRVVSDLLGHSTVAFTLDTFGHAIPGAHEAALNQVFELISSAN
ncbi:MAG: tyrosine-type recombinase/integrase [Acidimicrobiia bacterium]